MKKLKNISFLLFCCISLSLSAQTGTPVIHSYTLPGGNMSAMSDNGLWATATGSSKDAENPEGNRPRLIDLTSGEVINLPMEEGGSVGSAQDITDDGKMIVGSYEGLPAYYKDAKWTKLPMPTGTRGYTGNVSSVSPDGKYMAGILVKSNTIVKACAWKDGELLDLPNLPTIDAVGENKNQQYFREISADGKQILGVLSYSYYDDGCCAFVYHTEAGTYDMIGLDVLQTDKYFPSFVDQVCMSNNGRYVSGMVHLIRKVEGSEYPLNAKVPFLYEVQTKKFTLYEEDQDMDICVYAVGNDGTMFGCTPAENPERTLIVRSGNYWIDLGMTLKQRYDTDYSATTGFTLTGFPCGISDDGKTLSALSMTQLYSYSAKLPDTWTEAVKGINLLADCTVSPATKSRLTKLNQVSVTFERAPYIKDGAKAFIYQGETLVATSTGIVPDTKKTFTITFPLTTLEAEKNYTVRIPEGCFGMEGSDMQNVEVNVNYIGRAEVPVSMTSSSPADGDKVTQLGYNNMLTMQFDTNLKVVSGKSGFLYLKEGTEPICPLALVANGSRLYAYPLTERKLIRGSEYRVCIQAGAVTDITGYCPNDSITLNYIGKYQMPAGYRFFDDFSDTGTSLGYYLLYDGDKRTPVAQMQEWLFDSENKPWNFQIRDDESSDLCAGSHSMYEPAGASDDWMVLPLLDLTNEYFYLSFQAQSYKKDKADSLKVYVLESDDALNAMNAAIAERFRTEGKLIYKGQETPGENEDVLLGEWTRHEVSLAEYKGKRIHIAFVNDNNNQSAVFLDSLMVEYRGNYQAGSMTEDIVANKNSVTVKGYVDITGRETTYTHLKAWYATEDESATDTLEIKDLALKENDVYDFSFKKPLPLTVGKTTNYELTVVLDDEEQSIALSVKCLAFVPTRRVVIEEGTGDWCSNCPLGIVALEYLEEHFPDRIIPVSIHNGDTYSFDAYNTFLGIKAFPTGRVNRDEAITVPMISMSETEYSLTSPDGNRTFMDQTLRDLEAYVEADIELHDVKYNKDDEEIVAPVNVRFAVDMEDANYNLLTVVVEDSLMGHQHNGFASSKIEALGEWANDGKYASAYVMIPYKDVARSIIGTSFYGEGNLIPSIVKNNETIKNTIKFAVPGSVTQLKNTKVICMLIDANTGKIINAARSNIANTGGWSAIDTVIGEDEIRIGTEDGCITVNGNSHVSVYTLQGMQVRNEALQKGIYIFRTILEDGKVYAGKAFVK